jgi:hypothetical protein
LMSGRAIGSLPSPADTLIKRNRHIAARPTEGFRIMYRARAASLELNYDRIANHGCDLSLVLRDC